MAEGLKGRVYCRAIILIKVVLNTEICVEDFALKFGISLLCILLRHKATYAEYESSTYE